MSTDEQKLEAEVAALLCQKKVKKKKKHKKKKKPKTKAKKQSPSLPASSLATPQITYSYEMLLRRAYECMDSDNPSRRAERKATRLKIPPLSLCRYKTTRTCWSSFAVTCRAMNRPPDHVKKFVDNQLAIKSSVNGAGHLIMPTRMETRPMTHLLSKYVKTYVMCLRCGSHNTTFCKDKARRLMFTVCQSCHAESSVEPIQTGKASHVALKKGDRYRQRNSIK